MAKSITPVRLPHPHPHHPSPIPSFPLAHNILPYLYNLGNDLAVSIIDTNGFGAYSYCNFYKENYEWVRGIVPLSLEQLAVGPPQSIYSVQCANWPGGANTCLPLDSEYSLQFFLTNSILCCLVALVFAFVFGCWDGEDL